MQMSEIETKEVFRKTWSARAVQVSDENIEAVAAWCGGDIRMYHTSELGVMGRRIDLIVHGFKSVTNVDRAYIGDWVVFAPKDSSYMVYKDKAYRATFETREEKVRREALTEPEIAARNRRFSEVVLKALREQDDLTFNGQGFDGYRITNKVVEEINKLFI